MSVFDKGLSYCELLIVSERIASTFSKLFSFFEDFDFEVSLLVLLLPECDLDMLPLLLVEFLLLDSYLLIFTKKNKK